MRPSYLDSYENLTLRKVTDKAWTLLESCSLCPRRCGVNRLQDKKGTCKTGLKARVCNYMSHHGEEPPISGTKGSGTIFFSYCNMHCVYCQNYEFSQKGEGREVDSGELADMMLELQASGCHNINLVSPTHVMPQILKSLQSAVKRGLHIPLVYNTGGFELAQNIGLLEGIVDIYLPDMRYADGKIAVKYSDAPDYPRYNGESVKEMHRQAGIAKLNAEGIIERGLIIRHLVLPAGISGTEEIMRFISRELSPDTYVSLMSQYYPCYRSADFPEIDRRISRQEYQKALGLMHEYGLYNGWTQESFGLARFAGIHIKPIARHERQDA